MTETEQQAPAEPAENGEPVPAPTPEQLLAEAEARAAEHWTAYLRVAAELENFRKRAAREIDAARQFGVERLAAELLPVADSLGLALNVAATTDPATLAEGHRATLRLLQTAFERAGITELDPAGQPFDPRLHEAMTTRPSADHPAGTVVQVVQKGYVLNGRLLRPARVIVSTAPEPVPGG
jgi:molecular chaperone GrpE